MGIYHSKHSQQDAEGCIPLSSLDVNIVPKRFSLCEDWFLVYVIIITM